MKKEKEKVKKVLKVKCKKESTSIESAIEMLGEVEKACNTGPIIGEARDVIIDLLLNVMVRDFMILSTGLSSKELDGYVQDLLDRSKIRDKEILKARKVKGE